MAAGGGRGIPWHFRAELGTARLRRSDRGRSLRVPFDDSLGLASRGPYDHEAAADPANSPRSSSGIDTAWHTDLEAVSTLGEARSLWVRPLRPERPTTRSCSATWARTSFNRDESMKLRRSEKESSISSRTRGWQTNWAESLIGGECPVSRSRRSRKRSISILTTRSQGRIWREVSSEQNRLPQALEQFAAAVRLRPDSASLRQEYGELLARKGRLEESTVQFRHAVQLEPDVPIGHLFLGRVLVELGRRDEAAIALGNAVRLRPNVVGPRFELALLYADLGRTREAMLQLSEVLRLDPRHAAARARRAGSWQRSSKAARHERSLGNWLGHSPHRETSSLCVECARQSQPFASGAMSD